MKLEDIHKKNPYEVPEGYFDTLTSEIQSKISAPQKGIAWQPVIRWALVPAMIVLVFAVVIFNDSTPNTSETQALISEIPENELLAYLADEAMSLDEMVALAEVPEDLLDDNTNILQGIDIEEESVDELLNTIDLNELYL